MHLENDKEIVGILQSVEEENNSVSLHFSCIIDLELPSTAIPLEQITKLVGKRIGILNVNEEFFIRQIK